jgi:hypothetical protein
MVDEITLATRKPLLAGDELTGDYALWLNEEQYVMKTECKCGEPSCRKTITGKDWRLSGVQRRYFGHFSPFINDLISQDNG